MKSILTIFSLLCCLQFNYSQVNYLKGVLLKNKNGYSSGDTLVFYNTAIRKNKSLFFIDKNQLMYPQDEIKLTNDVGFWDRYQFIYTKNRNDNASITYSIRSKMEKQSREYISQLEADNKFYKDQYIEDYLQQLLQRVHYPSFNKDGEKYFNVKILNDATSAYYPFASGTILLTTQLIANADSEKTLLSTLTKAVGYILFDMNYKNSSVYTETILKNLGAVGSGNTYNQLNDIAKSFLNDFESGKNLSDVYLSSKAYYNQIASIISYTAWQEYYSQNYKKALDLLKKLSENNIANDEDYFLMAKIYCKISNTPESNHEALLLLQKALKIDAIGIPEIYSEIGLVLMRLNKYPEATEAFKNYEIAVKNGSGTADDLKWCKQMIFKCGQMLQVNDEKVDVK